MEEEKIIFVRRMIEGDEKAFDELYHAYSKKLYRMAYFITGNHSDSEDILQETFVKCYLHRKELKNLERFESWICQILVRTAWKMEKKKKRTGEISYEEIFCRKSSGCLFAKGVVYRTWRDGKAVGH